MQAAPVVGAWEIENAMKAAKVRTAKAKVRRGGGIYRDPPVHNKTVNECEYIFLATGQNIGTGYG